MSLVRTSMAGAVLCMCLFVAACAPSEPTDDAEARQTPRTQEASSIRLDGITTATAYSDGFGEGLDRWQDELPRLADVRITSSADGHEQPALWLPPSGEGPQPLLVVLHTWSSDYLQHVNIPLGRWADEMGWGMIHPNFRGTNDDPDATGSDLAVQDVLDAIDFASDEADIDADRAYLIGLSGGGYKTLLMAGRHPDRFAGAAAWVPIRDLVGWFRHHRSVDPSVHYIDHITSSCGGDPTTDAQAREDCLGRSPLTYLDAARDAGLPVYIGHGLNDTNVPPSHSARAFNQLADEADHLSEEEITAIGQGQLPEHLRGSVTAETYFGDEDPDVLFARGSRAVTFVLFDGPHDMVYHPGLEWMVQLDH